MIHHRLSRLRMPALVDTVSKLCFSCFLAIHLAFASETTKADTRVIFAISSEEATVSSEQNALSQPAQDPNGQSTTSQSGPQGNTGQTSQAQQNTAPQRNTGQQ